MEADNQALFTCFPLQVYPTAAHAASSGLFLSSLCESQLKAVFRQADVKRTFANLEEDVETEDAWEIASRRASVISRRPSNHSIRLPQNADRASVHGQSSTAIGMDGHSASVDDLFAGEDDSNSSESAVMTNSATLHHPLPPAMLRQMTAVQGDDEVDMPQTGAYGSEARSIPLLAADPFGSMSEVQTPMNDTFLSTLAPSVHQRLDLARQMDQVGRGTEPLEEEPAEFTRLESDNGRARRSSEEGWMEVDREGRGATEERDIDEARRDLEMMFT